MDFVDKWPSKMQGQCFFGSRAGKVEICNPDLVKLKKKTFAGSS